jgi:hypothetical protein
MRIFVAQSASASTEFFRRERPAKPPRPFGKLCNWTGVFDWEDKTRVDESASSPGQHRELMVYIWYPSRTPGSTLTSEYFPAAREIDKNVPAREAAKDIFGQS